MIRAHLDHLHHLGHRPGTIQQRRWCLLRLQTWAGQLDLLDLTEDQLYAFCSRQHLGPEARAAAVSHVRGFYGWAVQKGFLERDPAANLDRPRRPRHLPRPMPEADLQRALREAGEPIRSWLYLAAYGGLRCCEIAPLRGEDREGDVLVIREQKGGDSGAVPIGPVLDQALAHLPRRGWWFERWDGQGGPISPGQLQRHGNRFLRDLGIAHTMHSLRHRFVTWCYIASGRDLRVTQELARHRSITSTVGYTWVDPGDGRGVVAKLA